VGVTMNERSDDNSNDKKVSGNGKNENAQEDDSFLEGVAVGFVSTLINPFRWARSILGQVKIKGD